MSSAASSTISRAPAPTPMTINGWKYLGCYHGQEGIVRGSDRVIGNATVTYANMEAISCQSYCSGGAVGSPFRYFGVETGVECWCGSNLNLNDNNVLSDETDCDMACGGESKQSFGGAWYINVYSALTITTRTAPSTTGTTGTLSSVTGSSGSSTSSTPSPMSKGSSSNGTSAGTIAAAVDAGVLALALLLIGASGCSGAVEQEKELNWKLRVDSMCIVRQATLPWLRMGIRNMHRFRRS